MVAAIVKAFIQLNQAVLYEGSVSSDLKIFISLVFCLSSGRIFCQSHITNLSSIYNVPDEKIAELLNYEESDKFTPAERTTLNVTFKAASIPNDPKQTDFDSLKEHFNEGEIVITISLFDYLNRRNDTMATQVEMLPNQVTKPVLNN